MRILVAITAVAILALAGLVSLRAVEPRQAAPGDDYGAPDKTASTASESKRPQDQVYGTPGKDTIYVTVSGNFREQGTHYLPAGTSFMAFLKTLHERPSKEGHSVKVSRDGKNFCDAYLYHGTAKVPELFQLEDGDVITFAYYTW